MARVSNPANQQSHDTAPRLIKYLIKHRHWSPFEMASMQVEIETTRSVAAQILRHRSASYQEFCLAAGAKITVIKEPGYTQKIPISKLYDYCQNKTTSLYARSYDPGVERFINAPIKSVYKSGKKPVYEFKVETTYSEKTINCTREHRVLTKEKGFVPFGVAFDEKLTVALNGESAEPLPYQDPKVLQEYSWMGSTKFAKEFGIADVTARKWFRKHNITPYNPHNASRSSIDNTFSAKLSSFMKWARNNIRKNSCQICGHDGSFSRLELSHIVAHDGDPKLAFDENNLQTLCASCHREYDIETQGKSYGWTVNMRAKWGKIVSQTYLGVQETYDIEMDHHTHNFVADGIVVHNSQRYSDVTVLPEIPVPMLRRQDSSNKQASHDDLPVDIVDSFSARIAEHFAEAQSLYSEMLEAGVAKECARDVLPLATPTRLYMSATIRTWVHYIEVRAGVETQLEHRMIAKSIKKIFTSQFPAISEAMGW